MTKITKLAAGALAALTITAGVARGAEPGGSEVEGRLLGPGSRPRDCGAASSPARLTRPRGPGYYVGGPVGCRWVARYDGWGNYRGSVKVCDLY